MEPPKCFSLNIAARHEEMPGRGLEPLRIAPPDPKSGASANFATLALLVRAREVSVASLEIQEDVADLRLGAFGASRLATLRRDLNSGVRAGGGSV